MYALNPVIEYKLINDWLTQTLSSPISPNNLVKALRKHLGQRHPINLKLHDGTKYRLELSDFAVGAEYDPIADSNHLKHFFLDVIISYPKETAYQWSAEDVTLFGLELVESLVHEYEHRRQYRNRRYREHKHRYTSLSAMKTNQLQLEYLSHPDEIEAYASNIAARLFLLGIDLNTVSDRDSLDLRHYISIFGKEHPVTKELYAIMQHKLNFLEGSKDGQEYKKSRRAD